MRLAARLAVASIASFLAVATPCAAVELATAQGAIAIAPAVRCADLSVEARAVAEDRLVARSAPRTDETGRCRYAVSVPAGSALRLRVVARVAPPDAPHSFVAAAPRFHAVSGSVQIRWTALPPRAYVFAPGELATIALRYEGAAP